MVDSESGLPWLKNIPGLSWLFKSTGKSEAMEEVLVFITPTILPPQTAAIQPPGGDNPAGAAR
jgi:type IV pilus assembly protein PilQ